MTLFRHCHSSGPEISTLGEWSSVLDQIISVVARNATKMFSTETLDESSMSTIEEIFDDVGIPAAGRFLAVPENNWKAIKGCLGKDSLSVVHAVKGQPQADILCWNSLNIVRAENAERIVAWHNDSVGRSNDNVLIIDDEGVWKISLTEGETK